MNLKKEFLAIIVLAALFRVTYADVSSLNARKTPDWFRKGVMYQIQPRAFLIHGASFSSRSAQSKYFIEKKGS